MQEPDFWATSAEAMELTIEGNRLIAGELADLVRALWYRLGAALTAMMDRHTICSKSHAKPKSGQNQ